MHLTINHWLAADQRMFRVKKKYIHSALRGETGIINGVIEKNKEDIFYMLLFCLCVPQSKAIKAEEAIDKLRNKNFYTKAISPVNISNILIGLVRFHTTKTKRLFEARELFFRKNNKGVSFWDDLCSKYQFYLATNSDIDKENALHCIRDFLMSRINGMGMKLSSHFMRNIGMAGLAILDVHVIDGLYKRGIINTNNLSLSKSEYLIIEQKMKDYAIEVGVTLDELDLLLWSQKTGYVFK